MLPKGYLVGNVVADPQCGISQGQNNYARFSVACNDRFARMNEAPRSHFFNLVSWGKNAHFIQEFVKKGDKVLIEFYASTTSYVNQEGKTIKGIDFVVSSIEKIGGNRSSTLQNTEVQNSSKPSSGEKDVAPDDDDETSDISLDDIF